jgi:hypothetical protein
LSGVDLLPLRRAVVRRLAELDASRPAPRVAIAGLVAIVIAVVLGWHFGGGLRASPPPVAAGPSTIRVTAGPVRLQLNASWTGVAPAPGLAGSGLPDLRAFTVAAGLPTHAWLALAPVDAASLVPARVRARIAGHALPVPTEVTLAGRPAWSYDAIPLVGGDLLRLTVQPTTAGTLILGCQATRAWWRVVAGCARDVRTIAGPQTLAPTADLAYRLRARAPLARLRAKRHAAGHALRRARTLRGQVRAARRLAAAHTAAAAAIAPLAPAHGPAHRVELALRRSAHAFAALAHHARDRRPRGYRRAQRQVRRDDARLETALERAAG